jgi:hypothetical protein
MIQRDADTTLAVGRALVPHTMVRILLSFRRSYISAVCIRGHRTPLSTSPGYPFTHHKICPGKVSLVEAGKWPLTVVGGVEPLGAVAVPRDSARGYR